MGACHMPEDAQTVDLEKNQKSLGYYQTGIDIDLGHNDGSITMGLFCEKAHIVAGKIPPKYTGGNWLFVKERALLACAEL